MEQIQKTMKAVVIENSGQAVVRELSTPVPRTGQVLIRIEECLLCTWEQRIFSGASSMALPFIPGHEAAGVIASVPEGTVCSFRPGDRVAFKTLDHCGHCRYCFRGYENLCTGAAEKRDYDGIPGSGGLAQYIALDVGRVFPVHGDIPLQEAAFTEPLACCIHSVRRTRIGFGSRVAVIGAGIMGQLHAQLARLSGAQVIVVEPDESRRAMATSLGAHGTIDPRTEQEAEEIRRLTAGEGLDAVFVTTANPDIASRYIGLVQNMGEVVFYGSFSPNREIPIDPNHIHYSEKVITGSASPSVNDMYTATSMLAQKTIPVSQFISAEYPMEQAQDAFEAALRADTYRVVIHLG